MGGYAARVILKQWWAEGQASAKPQTNYVPWDADWRLEDNFNEVIARAIIQVEIERLTYHPHKVIARAIIQVGILTVWGAMPPGQF